MTENAVECAVAERETGHANSATRRFARPRRAEGANRPSRLHIRPRFRSFLIRPGPGHVDAGLTADAAPDGKKASNSEGAHAPLGWTARNVGARLSPTRRFARTPLLRAEERGFGIPNSSAFCHWGAFALRRSEANRIGMPGGSTAAHVGKDDRTKARRGRFRAFCPCGQERKMPFFRTTARSLQAS